MKPQVQQQLEIHLKLQQIEKIGIQIGQVLGEGIIEYDLYIFVNT